MIYGEPGLSLLQPGRQGSLRLYERVSPQASGKKVDFLSPPRFNYDRRRTKTKTILNFDAVVFGGGIEIDK